MRTNSPPHEMDNESDTGIENEDEVYEIEDIDDLELLEQQLADDEAMEDEDLEEEIEEGEGIFTAKIIFTEHKGSVFSVALSPDSKVAASGGEDDLAYIWDVETGSTLLQCTGHKDSVTQVSFSHDGVYLATADMKGFIQVWKVETKSKVWEFETDDVNWMIWHPSSNVLFAGTITGEVWMWLIPTGLTKSLSAGGSSSECAVLMRDGKRLCVGSEDGTIKVLDLKEERALRTFKNHSVGITTVSSHQDNNLVFAGSLDGNASILSTQNGKVVATFNCSFAENTEVEEDVDEVEAVSFCPLMSNLAVTATRSGLITIWDIQTKTFRQQIDQLGGTSTIRWHPTNPFFFATGLNGKVSMYDVRSADQKGKYVGHSKAVLDCDISKDGTKLLTSSDDGTARIFKIESIS